MTDNSRSANWLVHVLLIVLVVVAFLAGRHSGASRCPPEEAEAQEDGKLHDAVEKQLKDAEAAHAWGADDQAAFEQKLAGLSFKSRIGLARKLATLINNKAVKLKPEPPSPAPQICPCVPGYCGEGGANTPPAVNPPPPQMKK